MPTKLSQYELDEVTNNLSTTRLGTYMTAAAAAAITPLDLYTWNALISSAFFSSIHICEVTIRNGVSDALTRKYGAEWPWNPSFEKSLSPGMQKELIGGRIRNPIGSTGKVIADLKFVFWCQMFTSRHDHRLWNPYLYLEFPHLPTTLSIAKARERIYAEMEILRKFRNRIAHHEPIFAYPLEDHHKRIKDLIELRCNSTSKWLTEWETVSGLLATKPYLGI